VETKKLQLYLNGSFVQEQNITKALSDIGEASALIIGNIGELEFLAGTNTPAPYNGMLDELKVFNYALSSDEIMAQYYTSPLPIQAYSPVPANTGTANDAQKAAVSWQGGINTNLYKIYLGTTADNLSYMADVEVNTASYQFTGLTKSSTYFWRVDAFGPAGTTQGNVWSFTTAAFPMGIVGDWRLDGTTGTDIVDYSEYLNHGTLENAVDYSWEAGRLNNALNIKAAAPNTAISIPHQEQIKFDKNSFSISFWMKAVPPASSSTSAYILHKGTFAKNTSGGTGRWYGLELKNNQIYFSVDDDITKTTVNMSSASFLTNNWVQVVLIRDMDAKTLKIYKDGVLAASGSDKTANAIGGVQPLIFANNFDLNAPFLGSLDEIKLFNYVLSETEITTLAQAQALPVNLASYRAKAEPDRVQLKWITFSEQNNDRFEVERSLNNSDFKFLLSVKGSGTTNDKNFYTAYDNSPLNGTNYYRLVQYDRDGAAKVLGVEAVSFTLSSSPSVLVYPNPASRQLNIRLPFSQSESIIARLIGLDGREVFKNSIPSSGSDLFTIDLEKKPANGIYILEISGGEFRSTSKIIIE